MKAKWNSLHRYFHEVSRYKPLSSEEEQSLCRRINKGDDQALNTLVRANLRFVISIARSYSYQGVPLNDLIQAGNVGLIKAAQKFDADKNFRFVSYAVWWIRQAILTTIAEQSRSVRLNSSNTIRIIRMGKAWEKLQQRLQREPTRHELSVEAGLNENGVESILQVLHPHASFDGMHDFYGEEDESIGELMSVVDRPTLLKQLSFLRAREKAAVELYYGFQDGFQYTMLEISHRLGVSRERVRQILSAALNRLRGHFQEPVANLR
jgi:RNA polymerase primary sigma factor